MVAADRADAHVDTDGNGRGDGGSGSGDSSGSSTMAPTAGGQSLIHDERRPHRRAPSAHL